MRKIFAVLMLVGMLAALLCACGEENNTPASVSTTVNAKYEDNVAKRFADSFETDGNDNTTYEFTGEQYNRYTAEHNNILSADMMEIVSKNHPKGTVEFVTIEEDKKAVLVGTHEGMYDSKIAEEEAPVLAEYGFKYFQNLQTPINDIRVVYIEANDPSHTTEFASFEYSAK